MDTARTAPTPQQALDQLAATQVRALGSARDRRAHALGTAVAGTTTAVLFAAQPAVSGGGEVVLGVAFVLVFVGAACWVERVARTAPRRSRRAWRVGMVATWVVALTVVLPWLNLSAQTAPVTWSMVLVGAAVAAVPSLVAAAVIAGRRG